MNLHVNKGNYEPGVNATIWPSLRRTLVRSVILFGTRHILYILATLLTLPTLPKGRASSSQLPTADSRLRTPDSRLQTQTPNIIIIYADDLGYGDLSCYGARAVKTANIDYLAANGIRFTDAHCTAATCTPSRFSLLTGKYAFRNNAAILPGDAPLIIDPQMATLPKMLKRSGYATAVVGKWHLGLGTGNINWNGEIAPGPKDVGFDYHFIIPATTDRVPTVFVENGRVPNLNPSDPISVSYTRMIGEEPPGLSNPELLKQKADTQHSNTITNGISRIGYMTGGKSARWVDEDIPFVLDERATNFITAHRNKPFFLYYAFPNIHVPRTPNKKFVGSTKMGARGDVIVEMDFMVGKLTQVLDSLQILDNTLIIFSSDNGPVLDDGYADYAENLVGDHKAAGIYRGGKYSAYEGGTRVPMIMYWKGKLRPMVSDALLSHIDFYASLASLTNTKLSNEEAPDSQNQLNALLGKANTGRMYLLEESYTFSLRKGNWKYIAPLETGTPSWLRNKKIETGLQTGPALYNTKTDASEQKNIASAQPELLQELKAALMQIKAVPGAEKEFEKSNKPMK